MKEKIFTSAELSELESLQIRGGATGDVSDPLAQVKCVNKDQGCGVGVDQTECTNEKDSKCSQPWNPDPGLKQVACYLHLAC